MKKKTTAKKLSLLEEVEQTEDRALKKINTIRSNCEERTGRELPAERIKVQFTTEESSKEPNVYPNGSDTLREFVRVSAGQIRKNWKFEDSCAFLTWAEPYFQEGWDNA